YRSDSFIRESIQNVIISSGDHIWRHWVHFLNVFYFRRAQRLLAEKYSKYGPNGLMAKNQDRDPVILSLPF
ncbi:MAG TPA: hypothetical protein VKA87_06930, partial [Nitrososphaeraceae archaeon]|nr:hypothetical protein [Nitrososphaeraceae archaeon]